MSFVDFPCVFLEKIWDAQRGTLLRTFANLIEEPITSVCMDNRQRKVIVGSSDGKIKVGSRMWLTTAIVNRHSYFRMRRFRS